MNDPLIDRLTKAAASVPEGGRVHALIAAVANHCATICEALADSPEDDKEKLATAAMIMRHALVYSDAKPALKPTVQAAKAFASQTAKH